MATIDVISWYTAINHQQGIEAVKHFLRSRAINLLEHSNMLLDMLDFCLKHNAFVFDDAFCWQQQGTAMGTAFAPTYAKLMMGWWEEVLIWTEANQDTLDHIILWESFK